MEAVGSSRVVVGIGMRRLVGFLVVRIGLVVALEASLGVDRDNSMEEVLLPGSQIGLLGVVEVVEVGSRDRDRG